MLFILLVKWLPIMFTNLTTIRLKYVGNDKTTKKLLLSGRIKFERIKYNRINKLQIISNFQIISCWTTKLKFILNRWCHFFVNTKVFQIQTNLFH